jgi:predicted glycoside hydrolase/deacetylase ChbG (UPF0249 family)
VKRLVVCGDDFGWSGAVDAGLLRLARAGRLTAVSCLAAGPTFQADAPALLGSGASAGLHLDLTEGFDGAGPARLGGLILRSHLGLLDRAGLRRRLGAQLDAFERVAGRPPDFVDGHRHVHQLPVIAPLLVEVLARRYRARPPLVRVTWPRRWRGAKAALIAALGGWSLRRRLVRHGLPANADFAGVYGFGPGAPYRRLVQGWLRSLDDGGMLMCHPGEPGAPASDAIAAARVAELAYLESEAFEADCGAAGVVRVPVAAQGAPGSPCDPAPRVVTSTTHDPD